jgi:hypothetical protein
MSYLRLSVKENAKYVPGIKVLLDGLEVQNRCVEADPIDGYVDLYLLDEAGHFRLDERRIAPMVQRFFGTVELRQEL